MFVFGVVFLTFDRLLRHGYLIYRTHIQGQKLTLVVAVSVVFKPGSLLRISVASHTVDRPRDWHSFIVKLGDIHREFPRSIRQNSA